MLNELFGDIFTFKTLCLVCPVNCVGTLGAGLAYKFKNYYPDYNAYYRKACTLEEIKIGKIDIFERNTVKFPKFIISFPTKNDWKYPSRFEYIEDGLNNFLDLQNEIHSKLKLSKSQTIFNFEDNDITKKQYDVIFPLLGTGLGRLNPKIINDLMRNKLKKCDMLDVAICGI